ncbi:MAG: hypothetical protein U0324_16555 [Polyangiales bacterium]
MKVGLQRWGVLAALVASSCGGDEVSPNAGPRPPRYAAPSCPGELEAPLRRPDGAHVCTRVGAPDPAASGEWPDTAGAAAPVVFVRAGASGGGTRDAPYGDLTAALAASPPPATVAVARGELVLGAALVLTRSVAIVGAGAGATVLRAEAGVGGVRVSSSGASVAVTLAGLTVRGDPAAPAVEAEGAGATLTLRGVALEGGADGLRVLRDAVACAADVTARGARQRGVVAAEGAAVFLRGAVVRGNGEAGVIADRSHLHLERSLVAANGRDGVAIRGALRGGACMTDADCAAPPPCAGFELARRCVADFGAGAARHCTTVDVVTDVAVLGNAVTGLRASRSPPTAAEAAAGRSEAILAWAGPRVLGARVVIAGTRSLAGAPGGDGLYVGPTATVALDPDAASDAERGLLSELVANARAGALVDGDRNAAAGPVPPALRQAGRLTLGGARVASNGGPGVYVQERAVADRIAYTEVADNVALGLGVTSGGGVPLMVCNRFVGTRLGVITPEEPTSRPFEVGDGASLAQGAGTGGRTRVVDSEFSDNGRFGLVLDGYDATLDDGANGGNRGAGNAYGLALYGAARVDGTTAPGAIRGLNPTPPAAAPTVRGAVATGGP